MKIRWSLRRARAVDGVVAQPMGMWQLRLGQPLGVQMGLVALHGVSVQLPSARGMFDLPSPPPVWPHPCLHITRHDQSSLQQYTQCF